MHWKTLCSLCVRPAFRSVCVHAVQRFADLALSTLRLVFVAKQCGVTEPGKGKNNLWETHQQSRRQLLSAVRAAATSVFSLCCYWVTLLVCSVMNLINILKLMATTEMTYERVSRKGPWNIVKELISNWYKDGRVFCMKLVGVGLLTKTLQSHFIYPTKHTTPHLHTCTGLQFSLTWLYILCYY